jgi:hypothetical protein
VENSGGIYGANTGAAIMLAGGGLIVNQFIETTVSTGTVGDYATVTLAGQITGATGVLSFPATKPAVVENYGYIEGSGTTAFANGWGIALESGGTIINGSAYGGHPGTIVGYEPIFMEGGESYVFNHASSVVETRGTAFSAFAVNISGTVVNAGTMTGGGGVAVDYAIVGTTTISPNVSNSGSILATSGVAVGMIGAGTSSPASFVNDSTGLIQGSFGVDVSSADADITNFGTIKGLKGGPDHRYPDSSTIYVGSGIYFAQGSATITNGSASLTSAYVFGKYQGIYL